MNNLPPPPRTPKYEITETNAFFKDGTAETVLIKKKDCFSGNTWYESDVQHEESDVDRYETETWFEY